MAETTLSKRERQIMDAIHALGEAGPTEIRDRLDDPPTRTAVRTTLTILEQKGHVAHKKIGRNYVYLRPPKPRQGRQGRSPARRRDLLRRQHQKSGRGVSEEEIERLVHDPIRQAAGRRPPVVTKTMLTPP